MNLTDENKHQIVALCIKCEAVAKAIDKHTEALAVLGTHIEDIRDGLNLLTDKIMEEKPEEIKNED